tara:strand:+ start:105 stop:566 length:462 start_codon:yes stop_codon:yes gene_type:complete
MIKEVRHVGITVTDMKRSLEFYQNILGLKIEREMNESGKHIDNMLSMQNVSVNTVKMSINDGITLIELLEFKSHPQKSNNLNISNIGTSHLALTVDNLDDIYEKLLANNIKFNSPPQFSPDGYAKVSFCYDPDGTLIELVQVLDSTVLEKIKN